MPVGKTLSAERRKRGLSIVEIERITRVRGRFIEALENENWSDLPAVPYVKGYIQGYAKALRMDPGPFLREYEADLAAVEEKPSTAHVLEKVPVRTVVPHRFEVNTLSSRAWIGTVIVVVVILIAIWAISNLESDDDTLTPLAPSTSTTVESTATSAAVSASSSVGPGISVGTTSSEDETTDSETFTLMIGVASGESSWIRVTIDGVTVYEDTLAGNSTREWSVADQAVVRIGNPSVVSITRDGEDIDIPLGGGIAEVTVEREDEAGQ